MKAKNPLYVVNKKKGIVEEARGFIDYIFKTLNIDPAVQFFTAFFNSLLEQVDAYVYLEMINEFLSVLIEKMEVIIESVTATFKKA